SRRRHTRVSRDWSSDVCSSDLSLGINKGEADAWIEVGASQWNNDGDLVASFSNYGRRSVDVFAPGVKIHSTMPGSTYKDQQGTRSEERRVGKERGMRGSVYW